MLTRTRAEAEKVADEAARRGIPAVLLNQEGLYETDEARQVRDLLRAIADPRDPAKRLRAWLTPFFGLVAGDLPDAVRRAPIIRSMDRLLAWHAVADERRFAGLFDRILDESGLGAPRALRRRQRMRRLTNFLQLFDVLALDAARAPRARWATSSAVSPRSVDELAVPTPEEGNVLRAEGDARRRPDHDRCTRRRGWRPTSCSSTAASTCAGRDLVRSFIDAARAAPPAGGTAAPAGDPGAHQARPRRRRPAPLLRGAHARAQAALPALLRRRPGRRRLTVRQSPARGHVEADRRLPAREPPRARADERARHTPPAAHPTRSRSIRTPGDDVGPALIAQALADWRPEAADVAPIETDPTLAALRRARAGAVTTSYSRIKQAHGGYRPPSEILDEVPGPTDAHDDDGELPGGAATGIFLHALLEVLPLETLRETPALDAWRARDDVRALTEPLLRRYGRDPADLMPALDLAHAALTAPLPIVGGVLAGLVSAKRTAREMEFLFPFPAEAGGPESGFVKGFVDVIFEHEGRFVLRRLEDGPAARLGRRRDRGARPRELRVARAPLRAGAGADARHRRTRPGTRRVSAERSTSSCAGSPVARRGPRRAPDVRRDRRVAAGAGDDAGRRGGVTIDVTPHAHAWPPPWARDLVPAGADVDESARYLAIEAGGWPAALAPADRRAFALVVLASLDSRGGGATRLDLATVGTRLARLGVTDDDRAAAVRLAEARLAPAPLAARRRTTRRLPSVHRRRRLPLPRTRLASGAAPGRCADRAPGQKRASPQPTPARPRRPASGPRNRRPRSTPPAGGR